LLRRAQPWNTSLNDATPFEFRRLADPAPALGITERRAKDYAARHGDGPPGPLTRLTPLRWDFFIARRVVGKNFLHIFETEGSAAVDPNA